METSTTSLPAEQTGHGCLYLVSTPIGNLQDITMRALDILKEVDIIACEDTRQTVKLLRHYGIRTPMLSYHEHNELTRAAELAIRIEQGERIALVSDAGTPVISDPGHHLVSLCLRHRLPVVPIPGPSALIAALAVSGLPTEEFLFVGFLPARAGARRKALGQLAAEARTIVLYEAPHRLAETLADACDQLGPRPAVIAREVTKIHEEFLRGSLDDLVTQTREHPLRGEITLLIGPPRPSPEMRRPAATSVQDRVQQIMREQKVDRKAALKAVAKERGTTRREAYKDLLAGR